MRVGFLHLDRTGPWQSGPFRYGSLLSREARTRDGVVVTEARVRLTGVRRYDRRELRAAARVLAAVEVIHIQYGRYTWGSGRRALEQLRSFTRICRRPLVVTVHDAYPETYPREGPLRFLLSDYLRRRRQGASPLGSLVRVARGFWNGYLTGRQTLRWIGGRAKLLMVCTGEEARRIRHLVPPGKLRVVAHFVEPRRPTVDPAEARRLLGLAGVRVVTVQGFIYANKGHRIMVDALPLLPADTVVVFAGGPAVGSERLVADLRHRADRHGVGRRLRVTGHLSEEELGLYLAATHLAVCPFVMLSASGSLSTWLSVGKPILASDLPQIAEYNSRAPGAIATFRPYSAAALAAAVVRCLSSMPEEQRTGVEILRRELALDRVLDLHLRCYESAIERLAREGGATSRDRDSAV